MPRRRIAGILLIGLSILGSARAKSKDELKKWIDGPVRYLATKIEVQRFKELETDQARAAFVEEFWARRDPTPDTLANEYRHRFWERVQQANDNFIDSTKPGWMTDRGKVHILYGPPSEIQDDRKLAPDDTPTSGHGVVRWIYEGRPGERVDVDAIVVVPFVRSVDGEYRMSYEPTLASVFWDPLAIREKSTQQFDRFRQLTSAPSTSELSVMLDLGRMQEIPPEERVLIESVETMESYQTLPLSVRIERYLDPEASKPFAVINVDLTHLDPDSHPAILARFTPANPDKPQRLLGEDSFGLASTTDYRVAQARLALDPGSYAVTLVVADPKLVQTGIHHSRLDIAEPPSTLRLSDPVWASDLASVDYASLSSYSEPFHVGPFRVVPKIEDEYRRGEPIRLFFETYGAEFPTRVTYQLEGRENDGRWIELGAPQASEQQAAGVAWELETSARWPLGDYRVRIEVQDAAGKLVTTEVPFRLTEVAAP